MRFRGPWPIALGFFLISGGLYGGYRLFTLSVIGNKHYADVIPGAINIVGIEPGAGYKVIVANQMAQLVETQGGFAASDTAGQDSNADSDSDANDGAIKKRVPVREMLGSLKGDTKDLSSFVMIMNDMQENDTWPSVRILWTSQDIKKVLAGDKALQAKMVRDLNMQLDGTPLSVLRFASLENGIIVQSEVPVRVNVGGKMETLVAEVQQPYKPRMLKAVEAQYSEKGTKVDRTMQAGYYKSEAEKVLAGKSSKENIRASLQELISPSLAAQRAEAPQRILASARPIVNENFVTGASYSGYDTTRGKMYDLTVNLTDEGRMRLWAYSRNKVGSQLLLCSDGVAIAAPKIRHELSEGELTITQMENERLVKDAVDSLNQHSSRLAKR